MEISKITVSAFAACFFGTIASAETFSCQLKDARNSGWLPEKLVMELSADAKSATVYDPITYSTLNGFGRATVQVENSVRLETRWVTGRYRNSRAIVTRDMPSATPVRIQYRATVLRGGNKILMQAIPEGNQGRFSARGACQVSDAPIGDVVQP